MIDGDGRPFRVDDCPVVENGKGRDFDIPEMANVLKEIAAEGTCFAVLEQSQSMPGQGVASTWATGYGFGLWEGLLVACAIPYRRVRPCIWTKKLLAGEPGEGKARAIGYAMRRFPDAELIPPRCRVARDGRADALCLAEWARLTYGKEG